MSRKFIRITSGWIPVSVLLLFAAALVTGGEPQSGLQNQPTVVDVPSAELHEQIRSTLRDVDSVRVLVDSLGYLPDRVELIIDAGISSGSKAPGSPKSLRGFDHE